MNRVSTKTPQKLFTTMTVGLLLLTSVLHASLVNAHGGQNDECDNGNDIAPINANLATYTAPANQVVSGVCIKAGNKPFGDGHSDVLGNGSYENGCFTIAGVGTQTVVVTRNFESNQCQGISHIDVYLGQNVDPTNTPTPTDVEPTITLTPTPTDQAVPTNTPTPTPTEGNQNPTTTPTPTPDDGRNIDLTSTPTPTGQPTATAAPTTTPTAGPTATPTPGGTGGGSNDTGSSSTPTVNGTSTSVGQVLGATTLGATSSFTELLMNILFYTGCILIGVAAISYGNTKKRS